MEAFSAAGTFLKALTHFGPLDADMASRQQYAEWRAWDLATAIQAGRAPSRVDHIPAAAAAAASVSAAAAAAALAPYSPAAAAAGGVVGVGGFGGDGVGGGVGGGGRAGMSAFASPPPPPPGPPLPGPPPVYAVSPATGLLSPGGSGSLTPDTNGTAPGGYPSAPAGYASLDQLNLNSPPLPASATATPPPPSPPQATAPLPPPPPPHAPPPPPQDEPPPPAHHKRWEPEWGRDGYVVLASPRHPPHVNARFFGQLASHSVASICVFFTLHNTRNITHHMYTLQY